MNEAWRNLRVGDQVRIIQLPSEFQLPGYKLSTETRILYEHLISVKAILTVELIDEHRLPWVAYQWHKDGEIEYHSLAVDDNSWEFS
jgi:hypothetical protein